MLVLGLWAAGFYSLSCETYSGTVTSERDRALTSAFLFAVVRDVQRNTTTSSATPSASGFYSLSCETYSGTTMPWRTLAVATTSFYSLSCETYSGTRPAARAVNW